MVSEMSECPCTIVHTYVLREDELHGDRTDTEREFNHHSPYGPLVEARQKALNIDFGGNWLKENEISSLERFQDIEPQVPLSWKI